MFRPTLEQLEQREVYSVSPAVTAIHAVKPLAIVSHVAAIQGIAIENDEAHVTRHAAGRTETVNNNETITLLQLDGLGRTNRTPPVAYNQGDTLTHEVGHFRQRAQGLIYNGESNDPNESVAAASVQEERKFHANAAHHGIIAILIGM